MKARFQKLVLLAAIACLAVPRAASACPVCFAAKEETRFAFIATTVFLTLLPLLMIGGGILWLRRKFNVPAQTGEW